MYQNRKIREQLWKPLAGGRGRSPKARGVRRMLGTLVLAGMVLAAAGGAPAADPIAVKWFEFSPLVIPSDGGVSPKLSVKIEGNPSSVQLALAAGGTASLTNDGTGVWSAAVPAAQALFGYQPDHVNRNFVGFLDLFDGASRVFRG